MLKIENTEVVGWEAAVRGMRNPMNSWEKSDSFFCGSSECCFSDDEWHTFCDWIESLPYLELITGEKK